MTNYSIQETNYNFENYCPKSKKHFRLFNADCTHCEFYSHKIHNGLTTFECEFKYPSLKEKLIKLKDLK